MHFRVLRSIGSIGKILALAFASLIPVALAAQAAPTASGTPKDDSASKWDIFAGYSALIPNGHVGSAPNGAGYPYNAIDMGAILSVTRFFNKNIGVTFEGDEHILLPESNVTWNQPGDDFSGGSAGVVVRFPMKYGKVTPSFHAMAGAEQVGSVWQTDVFGVAFTGGGSLDVATPLFNHHLSVRLFQADYQYVHANFPVSQGGTYNFNPQGRLSAGLVYGIGSFAPPPQVTLSCTPSPVTIFPGDPETITATAGSLDPKLNAIYSWSGSGATGTGTTVTVSTGSLAPGSYTVTGTVKEGKPGREGLRPWQTATCSAVFTVKAYEPPTISCSASPSTINPNGKSTITAIGVSPQNRPLTYSYSAASGTISGTDTTATFDSTGAPTGPVAITCNVSDDKGQTATANTSVTISAPYVAPIPHSQALCSITFQKANQPRARVDNEAKACLDQVAVNLQNQADAKVVVVGESTADERAPKKHRHAAEENLAAQRAVNTKEYLVTDKGIDPSRVIVVTGSTDGQTVEDYLVPAGATFTTDVQGTTPVDENAVKPQVREPLGARHSHHHQPAAPPAQ
jgi:hypothetical protein